MPSPVYESLGQVYVIEMPSLSLTRCRLAESVVLHSAFHAHSLDSAILGVAHVLFHFHTSAPK